MKRVATVILNRNLPKETELLYETIQKFNSSVTDLYTVESGSEKANLSKYTSWWANWEESMENGLRFPRGFNFALSKLLEENLYEKYDFFFLLCNDAEVPSEPFLEKLVAEMDALPNLGILSPCSPDWGEHSLLKENDTKFFWYVNHVGWMVRRKYIDDVRELESPTYMNFLYDGENFRGYESEVELIIKGYVNGWATGITNKVLIREDKNQLIKKSDLIKTDSYNESLVRCVTEGKKWMRKKYGFNSRWSMQVYAKAVYDKFFEYNPDLEGYRF